MSPSRSNAPSSQALARLVVPLVLASVFALPALADDPAPATPHGDKTPQHSTVGPAVPLSAAQRAAIAAKPTTALPAPDAGVATAAEKAAGASVMPVAPIPQQMPIPGAVLVAKQAAEASAAEARASMVAAARPVRGSREWTTSPSLGAIPRMEWRLPMPPKPADMIWIATPEGGRQIPVGSASGGER